MNIAMTRIIRSRRTVKDLLFRDVLKEVPEKKFNNTEYQALLDLLLCSKWYLKEHGVFKEEE